MGSGLNMIITCRMCQRDFDIDVTDQQIAEWKAGRLIQRVMPDLTSSERELLMTRTCGACFDTMFPEIPCCEEEE